MIDGVCRLGTLMQQPPTEIRTRTLTAIAQLLQIKVSCYTVGISTLLEVILDSTLMRIDVYYVEGNSTSFCQHFGSDVT